MEMDYLKSRNINQDLILASHTGANPFAGGTFSMPISSINNVIHRNTSLDVILKNDACEISPSFATVASSPVTMDYERLYATPKSTDLKFGGGTIKFFREYEKPYWQIADANIDCKSLTATYCVNRVYTTTQASREANGNLSYTLPPGNTSLGSFTVKDFTQGNGYSVTATSALGGTTTVSLTMVSGGTHLLCRHALAGYLTNNTTGVSVSVCGEVLTGKTSTDFGIAVNGIAFHATANILTNDKCLGYAFVELSSFCVYENIYWKDKEKFRMRATGPPDD